MGIECSDKKFFQIKLFRATKLVLWSCIWVSSGPFQHSFLPLPCRSYICKQNSLKSKYAFRGVTYIIYLMFSKGQRGCNHLENVLILNFPNFGQGVGHQISSFPTSNSLHYPKGGTQGFGLLVCNTLAQIGHFWHQWILNKSIWYSKSSEKLQKLKKILSGVIDFHWKNEKISFKLI